MHKAKGKINALRFIRYLNHMNETTSCRIHAQKKKKKEKQIEDINRYKH